MTEQRETETCRMRREPGCPSSRRVSGTLCGRMELSGTGFERMWLLELRLPLQLGRSAGTPPL